MITRASYGYLLHKEYETLREIQEIWSSLRPRDRRPRLHIRDAEMEAAAALRHFFHGWGLDTAGVSADQPDLTLSVLSENIVLESRGDRQVLPKPCRFPLLARRVLEAAVDAEFSCLSY